MTEIRDLRSIKNKYLVDLNDFKVTKKIKSGGYGNVYHIQNKKTKKEYAAKILVTEDDTQNKILINREIGIMIRLQHPTIIKFYGYSLKDFDDQNNVTIIMDFAKNGSLATLLQNVKKGLVDQTYDNTSRQKILVGVAYAMMYLHQNRIIHRDLKPGNVLIDEFFNPQITDFGLSKIYQNDHSQSQTQAYGTPIYMAPEVVRGDRYNGKADVYSFAILMFEVITDSEPYPAFQKGKMSLFQFNSKVINEKMRPEFTVPVKESLKQLIVQCWSDNPDDRPTFEEIFNKIAFNIEESVYDIFTDNDEFKYYLEDVDVDEILSYAYDITEKCESHNNISTQMIDKIVEENKQLKKDNEKLKKDMETILEKMSKYDKIIGDLTNEIKDIKNKDSNSEKIIETKQYKSKKSEDKNVQKSTIPNTTIPTVPNAVSLLKDRGELNGIIKYLTNQAGGNIFDKKTIGMEFSDFNKNGFHPKNTLDFNSTCYYQPNTKDQCWFTLDFKDMRIKITSYSMKSCTYSTDMHHPKNWEISVSNDGDLWTQIDEKKNCSKLNGSSIIATFDVKPNDFSRYVRFHHTSEPWGGGYLDLSCIEFYGYLREN